MFTTFGFSYVIQTKFSKFCQCKCNICNILEKITYCWYRYISSSLMPKMWFPHWIQGGPILVSLGYDHVLFRECVKVSRVCACNYLNGHTEFMWMKEFHSHVLEVGLEVSTYVQEQGLGYMCAHSWVNCAGDVRSSYRSPLTASLYECYFVSLLIPLTFPLDVHSPSRFHWLQPKSSRHPVKT